METDDITGYHLPQRQLMHYQQRLERAHDQGNLQQNIDHSYVVLEIQVKAFKQLRHHRRKQREHNTQSGFDFIVRSSSVEDWKRKYLPAPHILSRASATTAYR